MTSDRWVGGDGRIDGGGGRGGDCCQHAVA